MSNTPLFGISFFALIMLIVDDHVVYFHYITEPTRVHSQGCVLVPSSGWQLDRDAIQESGFLIGYRQL